MPPMRHWPLRALQLAGKLAGVAMMRGESCQHAALMPMMKMPLLDYFAFLRGHFLLAHNI